jgi:hypothetical protein
MSNKPIEDPAKVRLKNVRGSFLKLFKAEAVNKGGEPKFSANWLLQKQEDAKQLELIRATIETVKVSKWGKTPPKGIKVCLQEGSTKDFDGYDETVMFLTSSSPRRPVVVDKDLRPLASEDGKPYSGCYCNVTIRLWAQDNEYGKRINAELCAVQFARDGEEFSGKPKINAEEEFTTLEDDEDDLS